MKWLVYIDIINLSEPLIWYYVKCVYFMKKSYNFCSQRFSPINQQQGTFITLAHNKIFMYSLIPEYMMFKAYNSHQQPSWTYPHKPS